MKKLSFDLLDVQDPCKTAGIETMSLAGLIAAALSKVVSAVPMLQHLQATNPTLYATIMAAASAEAASRIQQGAAMANTQQQPQQGIPAPSATLL